MFKDIKEVAIPYKTLNKHCSIYFLRVYCLHFRHSYFPIHLYREINTHKLAHKTFIKWHFIDQFENHYSFSRKYSSFSTNILAIFNKILRIDADTYKKLLLCGENWQPLQTINLEQIVWARSKVTLQALSITFKQLKLG